MVIGIVRIKKEMDTNNAANLSSHANSKKNKNKKTK